MADEREARRRLLREMFERRVGEWSCAPPLFRLLWACGVNIPPPHFLPFGRLALLTGSLFGLGVGALAVLARLGVSYPLSVGLPAALAGGVFFGTTMALWYGRQASRLGVPTWEEYVAGAPMGSERKVMSLESMFESLRGGRSPSE